MLKLILAVMLLAIAMLMILDFCAGEEGEE